jgi:hypothetical protein
VFRIGKLGRDAWCGTLEARHELAVIINSEKLPQGGASN